MKSVVSVPLKASAAHVEKLARLQEAFASVCNALAPVVSSTRCWNRVALHHMTYKQLRAQFPDLGSQMVCNAIYSVCRAARTVYQDPQSPFLLTKLGMKPLPTMRFLSEAPVWFDRHTLSIKAGQVSMYTLDGRMRFELGLSAEDEVRFRNEKLKEIVLSRAKSGFVLTFHFDDPQAVDAENKTTHGELPQYVIVLENDLIPPNLFDGRCGHAPPMSNSPQRQPQQRGTPPKPLRETILTQRALFVRSAWLTFVIGVLMLAPSWFMFEVYGRVLNSRNHLTLWMLLLMVVGIYIVIELLEIARGGLLYKAGQGVDERLRRRLFDAAFEANLKRVPGGTTQIFSDLRTVRDFIPSGAVTAVMDLPAALLLLVLLFVMSPWLGLLALAGAVAQMAIAYATERRTMPLITEAQKSAIQAQNYAGSTLRNAQVIESMGMLGNIHDRWMKRQHRFLAMQSSASEHAGLNATAAKTIQTIQSSLLLGGACWLVLHNALLGGGGMMIVASILGGRALQPLAQLIAQWRTVATARDSYQRVNSMLMTFPERTESMSLPAPKGLLTVEAVVATAPGSQLAILRSVTFRAQPGEVLVVLGPSASGKTTLSRLLVGVWPAASGKVRLDGSDVYDWDKNELGPHIGYVPQAIELFDGTIAENIARFGDIDRDAVRRATDQAGMTALVEDLPQGFDTRIGEEGAMLSGGQRQRLALARAMYGDPQLIVLDEPNANLDEAGEKTLFELLLSLKKRGATVVVITHRPNLIPAADKLLVLNEGQVVIFGERDEVLAKLKQAAEQSKSPAPSRAVATSGAAA